MSEATRIGCSKPPREPEQRVLLLIAAAHRDEREFESGWVHLEPQGAAMRSFGVGPHFCIGIHLARLEGQIMLREFLSMVGRFTIHPERGSVPASEFQIGWATGRSGTTRATRGRATGTPRSLIWRGMAYLSSPKVVVQEADILRPSFGGAISLPFPEQ